MKKILVFIVMAAMLLSLAACGKEVKNETPVEETAAPTETVETATPTAEVEVENTAAPVEADPVLGTWRLSAAIVNETEYDIEQLKTVLTEEAFNSISLVVAFSEDTLEVFTGDTSVGSDSWTKDENNYSNSTNELTFVLREDGRLSLDQPAIVLLFTKDAAN